MGSRRCPTGVEPTCFNPISQVVVGNGRVLEVTFDRDVTLLGLLAWMDAALELAVDAEQIDSRTIKLTWLLPIVLPVTVDANDTNLVDESGNTVCPQELSACTPTRVFSGSLFVVDGSVDLSSVAGTGVGQPGQYWRLVYYSELSRPALWPYPWQAAGRVALDGSLTGLPNPGLPDVSIPPSPDGITPWPGNPIYPLRSVGVYVETGCLFGDNVRWPGPDDPLWEFVAPFVPSLTPASDFPP